MARKAYRLWAIKDTDWYTDDGYTEGEAEDIINYAYDIDEDYKTKKDYIKAAKKYAEQITKKLGYEKLIDWVTLFGNPVDSGYRYCSRCDCYFWLEDGCECEEE